MERNVVVDVMFAAKHREPDATLQEAIGGALAIVNGLIAEGQAAGEIEAGDPQAFGTALFAVLQGLVSMANGGMLPAEEIDATVADATGRLLRGSAVSGAAPRGSARGSTSRRLSG
jgi:hypothetical protein